MQARPPRHPEGPRHGRGRPAAVAILIALAFALVLAVVFLLLRRPSPPGEHARAAPGVAHRTPDTRAAATAAPEARQPRPTLPAGTDALHAALREEAERLSAGVVVEGIEQDRSWVCAGEPVQLSARVGGATVPGTLYRWVWATEAGGAGLHPGPAMVWRAPATAGPHRIYFQVCQDLGGRRVGVLAEAAVDIEVRVCGQGQGQAHEPLRIAVVQRRQGQFAFRAEYQGDEAVATYAWDFGDGTSETMSGAALTPDATIEHSYPVHDLGPHDVASHVVKLEARLASGARLHAMAQVQTRGQPPNPMPPRALVDIARWQPRADASGWQSDVEVRNPAATDIVWDRLERVTKRFDGSVDMDTLAWEQVIVVEEQLEGGGFRGYVTVDAAEVPPEVKQIIDFLYGHDAEGEEVMVSWTPFKR